MKNLLLSICLLFSGVANAAIIEHFTGFNQVQADARYVLKSGDTMTGPLTVSGASVTVSGALKVDTASNTLVVDSVNHRNGFGTASPADIGHFVSQTAAVWVESLTGGGAALKLKNTEGEARINADANSLGFRAAGSGDDQVRLLNSGNVGIGTTAPATKVHISSGTITMIGTGAPSTGGALCLNASGAMSKCTSAVDASGNCTCP